MILEEGDMGESLRKHGMAVGRKTTKRSYQKFFDGWVEYPVTDSRGRTKREVLYVADYHVSDLPMRGRIMVRLQYVLLSLASLMCFSYGATRDTLLNRFRYASLPIAAAAAAFAWFSIMLLVWYLPNAKRMTNFQFKKATSGVRDGAKWSAILFLACAATAFLSLLFAREGALTVLLSGALYLLAALFMYAVWVIEGKLRYHQEPSGNRAPVGSVYLATMEEVTPPRKKVAEGISSEDLFEPEPDVPYEVDETNEIQGWDDYLKEKGEKERQ